MDSDDSADDDRCEMCGVDPTTRASNLTKRTLMTNAPTGQRCGHRFCGACVERVRRTHGHGGGSGGAGALAGVSVTGPSLFCRFPSRAASATWGRSARNDRLRRGLRRLRPRHHRKDLWQRDPAGLFAE